MNGVSAHDVVMDGGMGDVWLWWLEHGLDGIGGGLLAVAGLAVTLWFDRRSRREQADREALAERREVVQAVLTKALDLQELVSKNTGRGDHVRAALRDLAQVTRLGAHQLWTDGAFGPTVLLLGKHAATVESSTSGQDFIDYSRMIAVATVSRCQAWLRDPTAYDHRTHDQREARFYEVPIPVALTTALMTSWPPRGSDEDPVTPESGA